MNNKYAFGVTNFIGNPLGTTPDQFGTASNQNTKQDQKSTGVEGLVLPKTAIGEQKISEPSCSTSKEISNPATCVEDKAKSPDRALDENQDMKAPRMTANSKEHAKPNYDYLDQVNHLKNIRAENQRSKDAEELAKPKEIAKNAVRAQLEAKQREHVEVEARTMSILETQTVLMSKIVEDTKASLREVYAKQMKEEIYAQYDKMAAAHKEEVKSELVKKLTPEIKASLQAQYALQAKDEAIKQLDEELRSESIKLRATLKSEIESKLIEELSPEVNTILRAELTESVKKELRDQLREGLEEEMREEARANREHHYQDDDHYDNENHQYQNDDYDDNEEHRYRHRENRSSSPNRLNRDEQPTYHPSRFYHDEDLSILDEQGNKTDHVDEVQEEAPSSSALRGVKRSRYEQEYDEDDFWGRSPKKARISGYGGEEEDGGSGEEAEESMEEAGESEDEAEEGGEDTWEKGRGGSDTRGSSKEDAIDLVDSEPETEAIAPKVVAPVARSGPFLEDSDDEGFAETERLLLDMLGPRDASTGQDAQVTSSVGGEELPDYESEGEFDGEKTLVAG